MKSKPRVVTTKIKRSVTHIIKSSKTYRKLSKLRTIPSILCHWKFLAASLALALSSIPIYSQSHAHAPGVIINEIPAPKSYFTYVPKPIYVSDPSILVLSNGDYLASHAQFGGASNSSNEGKTQIFRSSDQGQTWTKVNGGNDLNGILRGSLFEHNSVVYISGSNHDSGGSKHVIMRSNDWGDTWE